MTISFTKSLALGGLCALFAGLGSAASAQVYGAHGVYHHGPVHHPHAAIVRQKAAYAHDVATGHYGAAERAHLRAQAIRHHVRARRMMDHGHMMDHGYGYHHDHGY